MFEKMLVWSASGDGRNKRLNQDSQIKVTTFISLDGLHFIVNIFPIIVLMKKIRYESKRKITLNSDSKNDF